MKTTFYPLIFLLLVGVDSVQAQKLRIGLKLGLNAATVTPSEIDQYRSATVKSGVNTGLLLEIPLSKSLAIQPEFLYSQAGFEEPIDKTPVNYFNYHLNYLSLPLLAKIGGKRFSFVVGPSLNYLVVAEKRIEETELNTTEDVMGQFNKADIGGVVGLAYTARFGLGLDLRYSMGLSNIVKHDNPDFVASDKYRNAIFQLGFHYLFGKRK